MERDEEICGEWEYTARDEPDEGEVGGVAATVSARDHTTK